MSALLLLLIITIAESSIGVFVKLAGGQLNILLINFYSILFAAIFLGIIFFLVLKKRFIFPKDNLKDTLLIGLFIALQLSLFNIAMTLAPIANVVIFWSVAPFFVFIFSSIIVKEKPTSSQVMIFIIALLGIIIANPLSKTSWLGNIIALITGITYALMVTYMRHEGKEQQSKDIFWSMLVASIYLIPTLFFSGLGIGKLFNLSNNLLFGLSVPIIFWILCLGMISRGVSFLCISSALEKINANIYSLIDIIISPLIAAIFGYLIFNEIPSRNLILGGIILTFAGFLLTKKMQIIVKPKIKKTNLR
jgi:drug/metabolite transporter (DMT)-like permease